MESTKYNNIVQEKEFIEFINYKQIQDEDGYIFEELKNFPKDLFFEHHNYFNLLKQRTLQQLIQDIIFCKKDIQKQENFDNVDMVEKLKIRIQFLELYKILCEKYGWEVCYQSNRLFERK